MINTTSLYKGITLMELLIVLIIIALLTSLAVPVYNDQIVKARRKNGIINLLELNSKIEYYFTEHHSFEGASIKKLTATEIGPDEYYKYTLTNLSKTTYTLSAKPMGSQLKNDTQCGTFIINQLGQREISGTSTVKQCW